ncbi:MAG: hypothetical protein ACE5HP_12535 [Gemmatimonadota bacterium]
MKIAGVRANNRKRAFEVATRKGICLFPYAKLRVPPHAGDRVVEVFPDPELGREAFTYRLESGAEDTIHLDAVLDYNRDPEHLMELLVHRLTVEARKAVEESPLSKRELIRRLGTSASQFYRLLDPAYGRKSLGQLLALLYLVDRDLEVVERRDTALSAT